MIDILYLGIAVIYLILTGFVLKQGVTTSDRRYFLFFLISLLLWHITLYIYFFIPVGNWLLLLGRFNYAMGPLFTFGLLGFFYTFPERQGKKGNYAEISLWVWTVFLSSISLFTSLIDLNESYVDDIGPIVELGPWYPIYMVHMFAMPLITVIIGARKFFKLKGLSKKKFTGPFLIFVPTMLAFVVTNGILPLYEIYWQFVYSPVFLIPIALSSAWAMYRYRFFDLPSQMLKVIRIGLLSAIFISIAVLISQTLESTALLQSTTLLVIISAIITCMIFRQFEKHLPELISKEFRKFRDELQNLQSAIYYTNTYENLIQQLEYTFMQVLHIDSVKLMLIREKELQISIPVYIKNEFSADLIKRGAKVLITDELTLSGESENEAIINELKRLNASVCLPIYLEKNVIGMLLLGRKEGNEPYSKDEVDEILKTHHRIELCFINILLQSNLSE